MLHDGTLTLAGLPGSIGTAGDAYGNAQAETDAYDNAQAETTEPTVGLCKSGRPVTDHRDGSPFRDGTGSPGLTWGPPARGFPRGRAPPMSSPGPRRWCRRPCPP